MRLRPSGAAWLLYYMPSDRMQHVGDYLLANMHRRPPDWLLTEWYKGLTYTSQMSIGGRHKVRGCGCRYVALLLLRRDSPGVNSGLCQRHGYRVPVVEGERVSCWTIDSNVPTQLCTPRGCNCKVFWLVGEGWGWGNFFLVLLLKRDGCC